MAPYCFPHLAVLEVGNTTPHAVTAPGHSDFPVCKSWTRLAGIPLGKKGIRLELHEAVLSRETFPVTASWGREGVLVSLWAPFRLQTAWSQSQAGRSSGNFSESPFSVAVAVAGRLVLWRGHTPVGSWNLLLWLLCWVVTLRNWPHMWEASRTVLLCHLLHFWWKEQCSGGDG